VTSMGWYPGKVLDQLRSGRMMQQVKADDLKLFFKGLEELVKRVEDDYDQLNKFAIGLIRVFSILDTLIRYHGEKQMYTEQQKLRDVRHRIYDVVSVYDDYSPGLAFAIDYLIEYISVLEEKNNMLNRPIDPEHIESVKQRLINLKEKYRDIRYNFEMLLAGYYPKILPPFLAL